jgi:hypothetical protein
MKKIIIILLTLALYSCEDFLVEKPKSIAVETFYNTKPEMEAAAYEPLNKWSTYGLVYSSMLESFTDYQQGRGSYANNSYFEGLNGTNITRAGDIWNYFYLSIRNANLVIMNASVASGLSAEEISESIAEAKFVRAFVYFNLVRDWAGVPIRTEDNFDELSVGRSSENDVFQFIISDLEYAETNLPDDAPVPGRACKWSAKALLADVYFYMNNYGEAASKSDEVIESGKYSLVPVSSWEDYDEKIFGSAVVTSSEEVFYIKSSHEDDGYAYVMMIHHPGDGYCSAGGYYGLHSDKEDYIIIKNWDPDDLRSQLWFNYDIGLGPNTLLSRKFIDREATSRGANDIPLYRYGDVLLLNAEAECRSGGSVSATAMERLNMIHRRAYGYDPLSPSPIDFVVTDYDKDSFVDLVMTERCYETMCECKRWFDLKRLGTTKLKQIIKQNTGKDVLDKHILFPIPDAEFLYNEALDPATDQNPGY